MHEYQATVYLLIAQDFLVLFVWIYSVVLTIEAFLSASHWRKILTFDCGGIWKA